MSGGDPMDEERLRARIRIEPIWEKSEQQVNEELMMSQMIESINMEFNKRKSKKEQFLEAAIAIEEKNGQEIDRLKSRLNELNHQ